MPELRKDPIVGRWVIIAQERAGRPNEFQSVPVRRSDRLCPFCEGNEDRTPPEIAAHRSPGSQPDSPGWRVRVVPNKFPALLLTNPDNAEIGSRQNGENVRDPRLTEMLAPVLPEARGEGIYAAMPGLGAHEVIIESPKHLVSISELREEQIAEILSIYRERLIAYQKDPRLVYCLIFKNVGPEAGASLEHIHSQLIVTPIVPINVAEEISGSLEFYRQRGRCVFCDMIQQELATRSRIVIDQAALVAFTPFASRVPFETWIVPKGHASHFENIEGRHFDELAAVLKAVIAKIEAALDRPAYNYIIHTAPFDTGELTHYHWHVEIMPSLTRPAGFEWGSGLFINPVSPEEAAWRLRNTTPARK